MSINRRLVRLAVLACALPLAGCLDFFDPDTPQLSTPAVLQAALRVSDQGTFQIDGSLQPGRDSTGFQRVVQSPFIQVNNFIVQPISLGDRGQRTYNTGFTIPRRDTGGPYTFSLPDVRDVGPLPTVRWNGLIRLDPDTIVAVRGQDIVLRLDTIAALSTPAPFRQWFLDVRAGFRIFRLSSDGLPPLTLRIPADFVPPSPDPFAFVSLIYFQTGQVRSATNLYSGNITADLRLNWVIRFTNPP